ncbi:Predicted L-lactate dehydrogenase, hypothetical protein subunit YkgG [hydrothermal vent metagenome]|uniref:LUD domain-containing protein n=1 Tax=hydrothermal vent metagenome TaxID=652676 RepID=A0A3B0U0I6_9ZZZZ
MTSARQEILDKLKKATLGKTQPCPPDFKQPVYHPLNGTLAEIFKQNLELLKGEAHICDDEQQLFAALKKLIYENGWKQVCCREKPLQERLVEYQVPAGNCLKLPDDIEAGITSCEYLVAHLGSVMVSSAQGSGREMFVFPPVHIVIAKGSQLVDYLENGYGKLTGKYKDKLPSMISVISGPSRTADIEKRLVLGAHGPRSLIVFIQNNI